MTKIDSDQTWEASTQWIHDPIYKMPPELPPTPLDEDGNVDPVHLAIMLNIARNALKMIGGGPAGERITSGVFQRKLIAAYTLAVLDQKDTWNLSEGGRPIASPSIAD